jgi:hypothetical protein
MGSARCSAATARVTSRRRTRRAKSSRGAQGVGRKTYTRLPRRRPLGETTRRDRACAGGLWKTRGGEHRNENMSVMGSRVSGKLGRGFDGAPACRSGRDSTRPPPGHTTCMTCRFRDGFRSHLLFPGLAENDGWRDYRKQSAPRRQSRHVRVVNRSRDFPRVVAPPRRCAWRRQLGPRDVLARVARRSETRASTSTWTTPGGGRDGDLGLQTIERPSRAAARGAMRTARKRT